MDKSLHYSTTLHVLDIILSHKIRKEIVSLCRSLVAVGLKIGSDVPGKKAPLRPWLFSFFIKRFQISYLEKML